ncbi:MAG: hypothetical protein Q4F72_11865, partial [Desulfovibrionaceae bacterium]|nr:hypothetical protein [Desulfovibrionaceae bacterium]
MQAYIRRDTKRGPRHGLIIISDVHTLPHPLLVTLQRFSDGKFFSAHGLWQSKREQLRAEVRNWENGTLSIGIGPEILSELDGRTKYRMNLGSGPSFPLALSRDLVHSLAECHMPVREERRAEHSQGVTLRPLIAAGIAGLMVCGAAFLYMQDSRQRVMEASASITYSDDINADVPDTALYTTAAGDADGGNAARMERISSAMFDQSPSLSPGASMKTLDLSRGHEVPSPFHKILKREMTGEALSEAR